MRKENAKWFRVTGMINTFGFLGEFGRAIFELPTCGAVRDSLCGPVA